MLYTVWTTEIICWDLYYLINGYVVDFKNIITSILLAKWIFLEMAEKLQFGANKLWGTVGKYGEWRRGTCFIQERRKFWRVVLNKSLLEKGKDLRLWWFLIGFEQCLVYCCWGRKKSSFFLLKADEIPVWKMSSLVKIILIFLLLVVQAAVVHLWELLLQGFLSPFWMRFPLFIFTWSSILFSYFFGLRLLRKKYWDTKSHDRKFYNLSKFHAFCYCFHLTQNGLFPYFYLKKNYSLLIFIIGFKGCLL